jgi:hypothetical protein
LKSITPVASTNGNGHAPEKPKLQLQPVPVKPKRVCQVCQKDDRLELIVFSKNGQEFRKYKCKRCDKWLPSSMQPTPEEIVQMRQANAKALEELFS